MKTTKLFRHKSADVVISVNESQHFNSKFQVAIHNDDNTESMTARLNSAELALLGAKLTALAISGRKA